jgi:hypothetical protein
MPGFQKVIVSHIYNLNKSGYAYIKTQPKIKLEAQKMYQKQHRQKNWFSYFVRMQQDLHAIQVDNTEDALTELGTRDATILAHAKETPHDD